MAKNSTKLSKKDQENLFIEFAQGLASLHSPVEMAQFIKDLLSQKETMMLARRLQIAKLLYDGFTYRAIKQALRASFTTIGRVHTWMQIYGDGYRTVVERTRKKTASAGEASWKNMRRRYPAYFWPQILLEEIVKSANAKQKARLVSVLNQLKEKTALNKELEQILRRSDI